ARVALDAVHDHYLAPRRLRRGPDRDVQGIPIGSYERAGGETRLTQCQLLLLLELSMPSRTPRPMRAPLQLGSRDRWRPRSRISPTLPQSRPPTWVFLPRMGPLGLGDPGGACGQSRRRSRSRASRWLDESPVTAG